MALLLAFWEFYSGITSLSMAPEPIDDFQISSGIVNVRREVLPPPPKAVNSEVDWL